MWLATYTYYSDYQLYQQHDIDITFFYDWLLTTSIWQCSYWVLLTITVTLRIAVETVVAIVIIVLTITTIMMITMNIWLLVYIAW